MTRIIDPGKIVRLLNLFLTIVELYKLKRFHIFFSRSIQSLTDPPYRPDMVHKQPSTPALHQQSEEPERFYQNVGFYPPPPPPPSHPANMPVRTYIPYSSSTGNISSSASGFRSPVGQHQPMQYYPGGGSNGPHPSNYPGPRPPPPNLNSSVPGNLNWARNLQQGQQPQQPGVNRDLLRQEAKMLEMQDELRRREERAAIMMSKAQQNYPSRYGPPQQQQQQQQPLRPIYSQQRPLSSSGPPPAAPHKPYKSGEMSPSGGHQPQFSASMGEIPKGAFSYNNGHIPSKSVGGANNPWDREAKEVEAVRKKEAAKYWRDQQIEELESLLNRSPSQDEQLRALKLEREFQRRAEEMKKDDDGENEEEEEEQNERKAMIRRLQEDLDRTRISSGTNGTGKLEPMEEERSRKIEEMKRKKMELEAAQGRFIPMKLSQGLNWRLIIFYGIFLTAAEDKLVREAAKRRVNNFFYNAKVMAYKQISDLSLIFLILLSATGRRA